MIKNVFTAAVQVSLTGAKSLRKYYEAQGYDSATIDAKIAEINKNGRSEEPPPSDPPS